MASSDPPTRVGDLSNVSSETINAWWGGPPVRRLPKDPADQAFEDAVFDMIEQRETPTAESLADATGTTVGEADAWLASYRRNSFSSLEDDRRRRDSERNKLTNLHRHYRQALIQAQQVLKQSRLTKGLPEPDVHDSLIDDSDPAIAEVLVSERRLKEFERENQSKLIHYELPPDPRSERRAVESMLNDIQDGARSVDRAAKEVARLQQQLDELPKYISEQRKVYEQTYRRLVGQHAEFWRRTGVLPDVRLPMRLEDKAGELV
jgi:hypothetical protein